MALIRVSGRAKRRVASVRPQRVEHYVAAHQREQQREDDQAHAVQPPAAHFVAGCDVP